MFPENIKMAEAEFVDDPIVLAELKEIGAAFGEEWVRGGLLREANETIHHWAQFEGRALKEEHFDDFYKTMVAGNIVCGTSESFKALKNDHQGNIRERDAGLVCEESMQLGSELESKFCEKALIFLWHAYGMELERAMETGVDTISDAQQRIFRLSKVIAVFEKSLEGWTDHASTMPGPSAASVGPAAAGGVVAVSAAGSGITAADDPSSVAESSYAVVYEEGEMPPGKGFFEEAIQREPTDAAGGAEIPACAVGGYADGGTFNIWVTFR